MDTLDSLLNEIENEIVHAKKATFSNTDIVVNRQNMLNLLTRLRSAYPTAVREAEEIKKERDTIIEKAENYAKETMDAAEKKAAILMSENEIYKRAQAEAEEMSKEASEAYKKTDYEARALAFNILDNTEKAFKESMAIINDRKRKLIEE